MQIVCTCTPRCGRPRKTYNYLKIHVTMMKASPLNFPFCITVLAKYYSLSVTQILCKDRKVNWRKAMKWNWSTTVLIYVGPTVIDSEINYSLTLCFTLTMHCVLKNMHCVLKKVNKVKIWWKLKKLLTTRISPIRKHIGYYNRLIGPYRLHG